MLVFDDRSVDGRFRPNGPRWVKAKLTEENHKLLLSIMQEKEFENTGDALNWILAELGDVR